ncbi:maleylpyruvate isomerase N-terminal domain-containing protein [Nocardia asiatica]|uniref:maleylpyruvate isomerase N-terminal domain-containing protein n=1 Tax=Nocardia asiatica TaxID=209252 RepID=UPI0002FDA6BA
MNDMDLAEAERKDLAAFLAGLTPQQWQMPTLCERWRVKDVVAHMISYDDLDAGGLSRRFVKGRLLWAVQVGVDEFASHTDQLLELLTAHQSLGELRNAAGNGHGSASASVVTMSDARLGLNTTVAISERVTDAWNARR